MSLDRSKVDPALYIPWGALTLARSSSPTFDSTVFESWSELARLDVLSDSKQGSGPVQSPNRKAAGGLLSNLSNLIKNRLVRCQIRVHCCTVTLVVVRVYILPFDVARRDVPRDDPQTLISIRLLLRQLDTTKEGWSGNGLIFGSAPAGPLSDVAIESDSLFYIFNTIKSPNPIAHRLEDFYDQTAIQRVLTSSQDEKLGLKTSLYPYQRRSIAAMIQREVQPRVALDPRLEEITDQDGNSCFLDRVAGKLFKDGAYYEDPKGGVLAETMGFGKTFIVLGLILATKDRVPEVPVDAHIGDNLVGLHGSRSLKDTASDVALRRNAPWRQFFEELKGESGRHYEACRQLLERPFTYERAPIHVSRTRQTPPIVRYVVSSTTLVIVPNNLFDQWQQEIAKHVIVGALNILAVDSKSPLLPSALELSKYDVILMESTRFSVEMGFKPRSADQIGEGGFPLQQMHFLRLVIDEGHAFASVGSSTTQLSLLSELKVERRWIVTGTPSGGMMGAEIELAADQRSASPQAQNYQVEDVLALRRKRVARDDDDLKRLGRIVTDLLRAQPWSNSRHSDDASWTAYTKLRDGIAAVTSVRSIMESLIVRHQLADIEAELPPLYNKCVYLEPTPYDQYTMDLFTFVLACNAITSERVDQDYIFDKRNWRDLDHLIRNLRRSGLYWTSFSSADIQKSVDVLQKYAEEHPRLNADDHALIETAKVVISKILSDKIWLQLNARQEVGYSVENLPRGIAGHVSVDNRNDLWNFMDNTNSVSGEQEEPFAAVLASKLIGAQMFTDERIQKGYPDPLREFYDCVQAFAERDGEQLTRNVLADDSKKSSGDIKAGTHRGVPLSGLRKDVQLNNKDLNAHKTLGLVKFTSKRKISGGDEQQPLGVGNIRLNGTVSAKLSYLLSQVLDLYKREKILIFYEGDDIAWYIAQGLELLGVAHFIYANGIGPKLRNRYHETFAKEDSAERVMLIDLKQGSHGLNIISASRIFFVNPVWNASAEAQAIKRAHRIGQTRPVHVETLVLRNSIEEKMFARRSSLDHEERKRVERNPLDDPNIIEMLQNFHFETSSSLELPEEKRFAPIEPAPLLFPKLHEYITAMKSEPKQLEEDSKSPTKATAKVVLLSDRLDCAQEVHNHHLLPVKKQARFA